MDLTIIRYTPPGTSKKEHELSISRARSHAARTAHARKIRFIKAAEEMFVARSDDWFLGGMEHTLHSMDDRAVALMKDSPANTTKMLLYGDFPWMRATCSTVQQRMLSIFEDLTFVVTSCPRFAYGVIDAIARIGIPESQRSASLKHVMQSSAAHAVRLVRYELDTNNNLSFGAKWLMVGLCMGALLEENSEKANENLRGLLSLRPVMDLDDRMDSMIWYLARTMAICHAVQTSRSPLYRADEQPSYDYWVVVIPQTNVSKQAYSRKRRTRMRQELSTMKAAAAANSTTTPMLHLMPSTFAPSTASKRNGTRIMSDTARTSITIYKAAVEPLSAVRADEGLETLSLLYNRRATALHRLCTIYSELLNPDSIPDLYNLDKPIIIALQIHLVLGLGGLFLTTTNVLCNRLYVDLLMRLIEGIDVDHSQDAFEVAARQRWEAWLFLTGAAAAARSSELQRWFEDKARSRMKYLNLLTEPDVRLLCNPFRVATAALPCVFLERAMAIVESLRVESEGTVG